MDTTARLDLSVWRNDDVCEVPLRIRGLDVSVIDMLMEVRLIEDTPGAPLMSLGKVVNGNAEGLRVAGVSYDGGVTVSDVRMRFNKSSRQALPYAGEMGDSTTLRYALSIAGKTRLVGAFTVLAHAIGSDNAPVSRSMAYGAAAAGGGTSGGATLTIAADSVAEITIDGADIVATIANDAQLAAGQAAQSMALANSEANRSQAAADVSGAAATKFFDTKAALVAANLPNGTVARVWIDESNKGRYTEYRIEAGAPVLKLDIPRSSDASTFGSQGFLAASFRGDNDLAFLDLFYTSDGKNMYRLNGGAIYSPGEMRDPSIILNDDGKWHLAATFGYNSTKIIRAVAPSPAGPWSALPSIECGAVAWAPSWFRHPVTGVLYLEVALADYAQDTAPRHMAFVEFTNADLSASKAPVSFGITGNYIDAQTAFDGATGKYSFFVKKEDAGAKYIERFTSMSYPDPGGWTNANSGDYLGLKAAAAALGGDSVEGPTHGWLNGLFYLMVDANSISRVFMTTAPSPDGPFSAPQLVDTHGATMRHFFLVPLSDANHRAAAVESVAMLSTQRIAELAPAARAAVPLDAALMNGWTKDVQFAVDRNAPAGYVKLVGEVSRATAPATDAERTIAQLPPAFANATYERFHCVSVGDAAGADLLIYKGFLIWERGAFKRINLGAVMYILDGAVTGLNGG
jgi:hypothetical protein